MTELEVAAALWKQSYETADFGKHPGLWVAHFEDQEMLGVTWGQTQREAELALLLASPFATCDQVSDTFVFIDRPGKVLVTHLSSEDETVRVTNWQVPYRFNDAGIVEFGVAESGHPLPLVHKAAWDVARGRGFCGKYGFVDAFHAATRWGNDAV